MKIIPTQDIYLCKEIKKNFDEIKVGGLDIKMASREGTTYLGFSQRLEVLHAHKGAEFVEGDELIVIHHVMDNTVELDGKHMLACYPEDILAVRVSEGVGIENYKAVNGFLAYPQAKEEAMGVQLSEKSFWELQKTTDVNGKKLCYEEYADQEIYINEQMHFYIKEEDCFSVDGVTGSDYYRVEEKDGYHITEDGEKVYVLDKWLREVGDLLYVKKSTVHAYFKD